MKEDNKVLALRSRRVCDCNVGEIMKLQTVSKGKEAVVKLEDGKRKIPVLVSSYGRLAATQLEDEGDGGFTQ